MENKSLITEEAVRLENLHSVLSSIKAGGSVTVKKLVLGVQREEFDDLRTWTRKEFDELRKWIREGLKECASKNNENDRRIRDLDSKISDLTDEEKKLKDELITKNKELLDTQQKLIKANEIINEIVKDTKIPSNPHKNLHTGIALMIVAILGIIVLTLIARFVDIGDLGALFFAILYLVCCVVSGIGAFIIGKFIKQHKR